MKKTQHFLISALIAGSAALAPLSADAFWGFPFGGWSPWDNWGGGGPWGGYPGYGGYGYPGYGGYGYPAYAAPQAATPAKSKSFSLISNQPSSIARRAFY